MTDLNGRPVAASTDIPRRHGQEAVSLADSAARRSFPSPGRTAVAALRLITVVGLGIDAWVHLDLASTYSEAAAPISEGALFRAEAVLALLTALAIIVSARWLSFWPASRSRPAL
jgi:hypothetical protein